jgi:broad specificity phosphatase PhoE
MHVLLELSVDSPSRIADEGRGDGMQETIRRTISTATAATVAAATATTRIATTNGCLVCNSQRRHKEVKYSGLSSLLGRWSHDSSSQGRRRSYTRPRSSRAGSDTSSTRLVELDMAVTQAGQSRESFLLCTCQVYQAEWLPLSNHVVSALHSVYPLYDLRLSSPPFRLSKPTQKRRSTVLTMAIERVYKVRGAIPRLLKRRKLQSSLLILSVASCCADLPLSTAWTVAPSLLAQQQVASLSSTAHRCDSLVTSKMTSSDVTTSADVSLAASSVSTSTQSSFGDYDNISKCPVHVYPLSSFAELSSAEHHGYRSIKIVNFQRHAQGTHNVNKDYRNIANLDARLTPLGKEQCRQVATSLLQSPTLSQIQLIITSPLTRCIQTVQYSMEPLLSTTPVMVHESIRETVNYNCDRRRSISEIQSEYPWVDYSLVTNPQDAIWEAYQARLGSADDYTSHRESAEIYRVAQRARDFFAWLVGRPETNVLVCSHAAFLRCLWNYGHAPEIPKQVKQNLDPPTADTLLTPVIEFVQYEDGASLSDFAQNLQQDFENCEIRSVVIGFV